MRRLMMGLVVFLGLCFNSPPIWAQEDLSGLYVQLNEAVSAQNWTTALDLIDQLRQKDPSREAELRKYRQNVEALAEPQSGSPKPLPSPVSASRYQEPSQFQSCGTDTGCFIAASAQCQPAQVKATVNVNVFGTVITTTTLYQLWGRQANQCVLMMQTLSAVFTQEGKTEVLESPVGSDGRLFCRYGQNADLNRYLAVVIGKQKGTFGAKGWIQTVDEREVGECDPPPGFPQ